MTDATKETRAPDGADRARPRGMCVRAAGLSAVREADREADFICSTDVLDSYGEIVKQNWNLTRFASNPVALWSHDSHALPVGQWRNVRVEDGALRGTFKAATAAANPHAEHVWQSIVERTVRAVSVGFMPGKVTYEEIEGKEGSFCVLDENELFEISPTPLPANPEAIVEMKRRALDEFQAKRLTTCGAVPFKEHPMGKSSGWNISAAVRRLRRWASSDGSGSKDHIDWTKYREAFAHFDLKRSHEFGGYRFPHHDVEAGALVASRGGVAAACSAASEAKIPDADVACVRKHLQQEAHRFGLSAPWESKGADRSADTLNTKSAPRATKEPSVDPKKKSDEEMAKAAKSTITCPECGAEFDPEEDGDEEKSKHAKAFKDLIAKRIAPIVDSLKAKVLDLTGQVADVTAKHTASLADLAASKCHADSLALKLVESELTPLSGVKYAPSAHDGHVDLAKHYLSQGEAGQAKWRKHVDGLKSAPSLTILGGSVISADPTPSGLTNKDADDGELAALVNTTARA